MAGAYPEMEAVIAKRGIKKKALAAGLGISERSLYNKLKGFVDFTWTEAEVLQRDFFPDMSKELLLTKVS